MSHAKLGQQQIYVLRSALSICITISTFHVVPIHLKVETWNEHKLRQLGKPLKAPKLLRSCGNCPLRTEVGAILAAQAMGLK